MQKNPSPKRREIMFYGKPVKISLAIIIGSIFLYKMLDVAFPLQIENREQFARVVVDEQGRVLRAFADENGVWRHAISLDAVSQNYIDALLGYEDRWFWYHPGVNPIAMSRAMFQNLACQCVVSGGSTLTMQVARIFHPHSKSISGKLHQIFRALQLEWHYSKQEILTLYLNHAPFGGTIEGVQAASQSYLRKNANELTDAEAALMAVLPQAPSRLRPDRFSDRARQARDKLLNRMAQLSLWTNERIEQARLETVFAFAPESPLHAPILARELIQTYPNAQVIRTYIDRDLQTYLEQVAKDRTDAMPEKTSMAMLVVENATGEVKAHVASADFLNAKRYGHVNMVDAIRSPGSTLKPFVYAKAIEAGMIHSHSLLLDAPRLNSEYRPDNFNQHFNGPVSTTFALQKSLNLPAVQTLEAYGPERFYADLKNAGVSLQIPGKPNLSIALGGVGASLANLVSLYTAFAHEGRVKPLKLTELQAERSERYFSSSEASWVVYKMLASAPRPDRLNGSIFERSENGIAWKTGTSYGHRDAWAIGVSASYTVGVWVGRPDGTPIPGQYGAATASPVLFQIMGSLPKAEAGVDVPSDVSIQKICWPLGQTINQTQPEHCHKQFDAWIAQGNVPPTLPEPGLEIWRPNPYRIWVDKDSGKLVDQHCKNVTPVAKALALWPRVIEPWISVKKRFHGQLPEVDARCDTPPPIAVRPLSIKSLREGNQYQLASVTDRIPLALNSLGGQGTRDWYINGRFIGSAYEGSTVFHKLDEPGEWELLVIDTVGNVDRIAITVREAP